MQKGQMDRGIEQLKKKNERIDKRDFIFLRKNYSNNYFDNLIYPIDIFEAKNGFTVIKYNSLLSVELIQCHIDIELLQQIILHNCESLIRISLIYCTFYSIEKPFLSDTIEKQKHLADFLNSINFVSLIRSLQLKSIQSIELKPIIYGSEQSYSNRKSIDYDEKNSRNFTINNGSKNEQVLPIRLQNFETIEVTPEIKKQIASKVKCLESSQYVQNEIELKQFEIQNLNEKGQFDVEDFIIGLHKQTPDNQNYFELDPNGIQSQCNQMILDIKKNITVFTQSIQFCIQKINKYQALIIKDNALTELDSFEQIRFLIYREKLNIKRIIFTQNHSISKQLFSQFVIELHKLSSISEICFIQTVLEESAFPLLLNLIKAKQIKYFIIYKSYFLQTEIESLLKISNVQIKHNSYYIFDIQNKTADQFLIKPLPNIEMLLANESEPHKLSEKELIFLKSLKMNEEKKKIVDFYIESKLIESFSDISNDFIEKYKDILYDEATNEFSDNISQLIKREDIEALIKQDDINILNFPIVIIILSSLKDYYEKKTLQKHFLEPISKLKSIKTNQSLIKFFDIRYSLKSKQNQKEEDNAQTNPFQMNYEMFYDFYRSYKYNKQLLNGDIVQEKIKNIHPWILLDPNINWFSLNVISFQGNKAMCFLNILNEINPQILQKMKLGIDLSDLPLTNIQFDLIQFNKIIYNLVELHLEKYNGFLDLSFLNEVFQKANSLSLLNISDMNLTNDRLKEVQFNKIPKTLKILNISENAAIQNLSFINEIFIQCNQLEALGLRNIDIFFQQKISTIQFLSIPQSIEKIDLSFNQIANYKKVQLDFLNSIFRRCSNLSHIFLINCGIVNFSLVPVNFELLKSCQSFAKLDIQGNKSFKSLQFLDQILDSCPSFTSLQLVDMNLNQAKMKTFSFINCRNLTQLNLSQNRSIENFSFLNDIFYYAPNLSSLILEDVQLTQNKILNLNIQMLGKQLTELNVSKNREFDAYYFLNAFFPLATQLVELHLSDINLNDTKMQFLAFETISSPNLTSITLTNNPIRKNFVRIFQLMKKLNFALFINFECDKIDNQMFRQFLKLSNSSFEKTLAYQNLINNAQEIEAQDFFEREQRKSQQQFQQQLFKQSTQNFYSQDGIEQMQGQGNRINRLEQTSPQKKQQEEYLNTQRDLVQKFEEEYMKGFVSFYDFEYEQASDGQWSTINLRNLKCLSDIDIYSCRKESLGFLISLDLTGFSSMSGSFAFLNSLFLYAVQLKKLNLSKCNLTDSDVFSIAFKSKSLQELNLSHNDQIEEFSFINKILQNCQKLQVLILKDMDLNDDKINSIDFKCLRFAKMKVLDFSQNYGIQDFEFLNQIIENAKHLEELLFQDIDIVDEQINQILFYKLKYTHLKKFILSQNDQLTNYFFINLVIRYSPKLDHLIISHQDIYSDPNYYIQKQEDVLHTTHAVSQLSDQQIQIQQSVPNQSNNWLTPTQNQNQFGRSQTLINSASKTEHLLEQKYLQQNQNQIQNLNQSDQYLQKKTSFNTLSISQNQQNQSLNGSQNLFIQPQQYQTQHINLQQFHSLQQSLDNNLSIKDLGNLENDLNIQNISNQKRNSIRIINSQQSLDESPTFNKRLQNNYTVQDKSIEDDVNKMNQDIQDILTSGELSFSKRRISFGAQFRSQSMDMDQQTEQQEKDPQKRQSISQDKKDEQYKSSGTPELIASFQSKSSLKFPQSQNKSQEDMFKQSNNVKWADEINKKQISSKNELSNFQDSDFKFDQQNLEELSSQKAPQPLQNKITEIQSTKKEQKSKQDYMTRPLIVATPQPQPSQHQNKNQQKPPMNVRPPSNNEGRIQKVSDEIVIEKYYQNNSKSKPVVDQPQSGSQNKKQLDLENDNTQNKYQVVNMNDMQVIISSQEIQNSDIFEENLNQFTKSQIDSKFLNQEYDELKVYQNSINLQQFLTSQSPPLRPDLQVQRIRQDDFSMPNKPKVSLDIFNTTAISTDSSNKFQRKKKEVYQDRRVTSPQVLLVETPVKQKEIQNKILTTIQSKIEHSPDEKIENSIQIQNSIQEQNSLSIQNSKQASKKPKEKKPKQILAHKQRVIKTPVSFLNDIFQKSQLLFDKIEREVENKQKYKQKNKKQNQIKLIDFSQEVSNKDKQNRNSQPNQRELEIEDFQIVREQKIRDSSNLKQQQKYQTPEKKVIENKNNSSNKKKDSQMKNLSKAELDFAEEFEQMVIENQVWNINQQIKQQEEEKMRKNQEMKLREKRLSEQANLQSNQQFNNQFINTPYNNYFNQDSKLYPNQIQKQPNRQQNGRYNQQQQQQQLINFIKPNSQQQQKSNFKQKELLSSQLILKDQQIQNIPLSQIQMKSQLQESQILQEKIENLQNQYANQVKQNQIEDDKFNNIVESQNNIAVNDPYMNSQVSDKSKKQIQLELLDQNIKISKDQKDAKALQYTFQNQINPSIQSQNSKNLSENLVQVSSKQFPTFRNGDVFSSKQQPSSQDTSKVQSNQQESVDISKLKMSNFIDNQNQENLHNKMTESHVQSQDKTLIENLHQIQTQQEQYKTPSNNVSIQSKHNQQIISLNPKEDKQLLSSNIEGNQEIKPKEETGQIQINSNNENGQIISGKNSCSQQIINGNQELLDKEKILNDNQGSITLNENLSTKKPICSIDKDSEIQKNVNEVETNIHQLNNNQSNQVKNTLNYKAPQIQNNQQQSLEQNELNKQQTSQEHQIHFQQPQQQLEKQQQETQNVKQISQQNSVSLYNSDDDEQDLIQNSLIVNQNQPVKSNNQNELPLVGSPKQSIQIQNSNYSSQIDQNSIKQQILNKQQQIDNMKNNIQNLDNKCNQNGTKQILDPSSLIQKQEQIFNSNTKIIEDLEFRQNETILEFTQVDYTQANENSVLYQKNLDLSQIEHNQSNLLIIKEDDDVNDLTYQYNHEDNENSLIISQIKLNQQLTSQNPDNQIIEIRQEQQELEEDEEELSEPEQIIDNAELQYQQQLNDEQDYLEYLKSEQDINFKQIKNSHTEVIELNNLKGDKVKDIIEQIIYNAGISLKVLKLENLDLRDMGKIDPKLSKLDLEELSLNKTIIPDLDFLNIIAGSCNKDLSRLHIMDLEIAEKKVTSNLSLNIFDSLLELSISGNSTQQIFQNSSYFNLILSRCFILQKLTLTRSLLDFSNIKIKHFQALQTVNLSYNPNVQINFINEVISNAKSLVDLKLNGIQLTSERANQIKFENISLQIKSISLADNPIDFTQIDQLKFLKSMLRYTRFSLDYFVIDHMFTQPYHILQRVCIQEDTIQDSNDYEKDNQDIPEQDIKEVGKQKKIKYRTLIDFIYKNQLSAPHIYQNLKESIEDHIIDIIFKDRSTCENILLNDLILSSLIQTKDFYLQNRNLYSDVLIYSPLEVRFQMINYRRRFTLDMLAKFSSGGQYNTYNTLLMGNKQQISQSKTNGIQMLSNCYGYILGFSSEKNQIFEAFYKQYSELREKTYFDLYQTLDSPHYSHLNKVFLPLKLTLKINKLKFSEGRAIQMLNFLPPQNIVVKDRVSNQFLKYWYCINYLSPLTTRTFIEFNKGEMISDDNEKQNKFNWYDKSLANKFIEYYYSRALENYRSGKTIITVLEFIQSCFLTFLYYFFSLLSSHQKPFLFDFTVIQLNNKLAQNAQMEILLFILYFIYLLITVSLITLFNMLNQESEMGISNINISSNNLILFLLFQFIVFIIDIVLLNFLKQLLKTIQQRKMSFLKFKNLSINTSYYLIQAKQFLSAQLKAWTFYLNYCFIAILYIGNFKNFFIPSAIFLGLSIMLDSFFILHSIATQWKFNKKYQISTYKLDRYIILTQITNLLASNNLIREYSPSNVIQFFGRIIDKTIVLEQLHFILYNLPQTILQIIFYNQQLQASNNSIIEASLVFNIISLSINFLHIISYNPTQINQEMFDELNQKKKNQLINLYETKLFDLSKYYIKKKHHETLKFIRFSQQQKRNEYLKLGQNKVIYKQYFESDKAIYQDLMGEMQYNLDITTYFEQ